MSIYRSDFFKFEIKFSEGWRLNNWSSWKKPPEKIDNYQTSDQDLPSLKNTSKQLFYAFERISNSPSFFSKQFEMSALWKDKDKDIDINNQILKADNETVRLITTERVMKREWQSLIRTFDVGDYNLYQQIYICNVLPNIWLYASVSGDTKSNFKSSKKQFIEITEFK